MEDNWFNSSASMLHCQQMQKPFTDLGIPVGGNPRRLSFWDPVISKLRARLSRWKQRHLSFGCRICLIKSALSSLPLYYMSFFKMPSGIVTKCNYILRRFLWGGTDGDSKIAWVHWEKVCRPVEEGGLGIRDWKYFNWALLGKWKWQMLKEKDSLWCQILNAKYKGMVSPSDSCWWKDLLSVCSGPDHGRWFVDSISRRIGDGKETLFSLEDWWGEGLLKDKFPRLFLLSSKKNASIFDMGEWKEGVWCWNFLWTRRLLDRESQRVEELRRMIRSFSPNTNLTPGLG